MQTRTHSCPSATHAEHGRDGRTDPNASARYAGRAGKPAPERRHLATQEFRRSFSDFDTPRLYRGWLHFHTVSVLSLALIVACVLSLDDLTWIEALTVPVTLLYANLVEYVGHRWPMHRRMKGLEVIYRHTTVHHRYFPHDRFGYEDPRDFYALLLPPSIVLFFFAGFALPAGLVIGWLLTPNCALLFVASATGYFLAYEWLHLCYHAPETSWPYRFGWMRALRRHHLVHHDPGLMSMCNFNITVPLFDWMFETSDVGRRPAR
ncbi:MAG: fatty acid hydroxylase family protein [Betaproteobacteria bacterium]|nr:fatty acid hydroxylase family protein [Betaproteobacteria bacterium]